MRDNRSPFVIRNSQFIILLTLVAFALRLTQLGFQPLWGDEGWSVYFAAMPIGEMLRLTAADIHPPLYYALLKGFFALVGTGAIQARLLSVLAGTLLVPTMAALGRRLIPVRGGNVAAAFVVAFAPMAIYYSQEVRMYGLVTLFGALSSVFLIDWLAGNRRAGWGYAITAALGLYTMYYAAFVIAAQGLFVITRIFTPFPTLSPLGRGENIPPPPERGRVGEGVRPFLGAAILYLPWVIFAARALTEYVAQKVGVESYAPLNLGQFLLAYLTAFSVGHPLIIWMKMLSGIIVLWVMAGAWFLVKKPEHREYGVGTKIHRIKYKKSPWTLCHLCESPCNLYFLLLYLFVPLILGWIVNLLNPFTPQFFERTLLVAAPAWWLLLAAGLVFLFRWRLWAGQIAIVATVAIFGANLFNFYSVPRYPDDDYRPLLRDIAARATVDDVLLASYQWQLGFYTAYLPAESRPQIYPVPQWGKVWGEDEGAMRRDLSALLKNHTLYFPAHQSLGHLWEDRAEAVMADIGFPTELRWVNPHTKLSVVRRGDISLYPVSDNPINFADELHADIKIAHTAPNADDPPIVIESGRGIIPIQINWTAMVDDLPDYRITLKLVDVTGEVWAQRDSEPHAGQQHFSAMTAGETLSDRHGLLLSAGTPPGIYNLELMLTNPRTDVPLDILREGQAQGVTQLLGAVTVVAAQTPLSPNALARQNINDVDFGGVLKLVGNTVPTHTAQTGDTLPVSLFWQGTADNLPPLITWVQLQNASGAVAVSEHPPAFPTGKYLARNPLLRDVHRLRIPAGLPAGDYRLAAGVLSADKTRLGEQANLGMIRVLAREHNFSPPKPSQSATADFGGARLIGFDVNPTPLHAGESLDLTLYFQSETGFNREWAIFAHLIDSSGYIWAQKDQFPVDGTFPTTAWVADEFITDRRQIFISPDTPAGSYRLEIGFYDPQNFERIPLTHGGDTFTLPISLQIDN